MWRPNLFFAAPLVAGDLTGIADGQPWANGRFHIGGGGLMFPESTFRSSCYFADVVFTPATIMVQGHTGTALVAAVAVKRFSVGGYSPAAMAARAVAGKLTSVPSAIVVGLRPDATATVTWPANATTWAGLHGRAVAGKISSAGRPTSGVGLAAASSAGKHVVVRTSTTLGHLPVATTSKHIPAPATTGLGVIGLAIGPSLHAAAHQIRATGPAAAVTARAAASIRRTTWAMSVTRSN